MPVDVSPYATLGQNNAGINLLGPMGQFAQIQNTLNQNQIFQQEFAARKMMGQLAQQSIDPETKQLDTHKFIGAISTHPETAWKAPEMIQQLVQQEKIKADTAMTVLQMEEKGQGAVAATAAALSASHGDNVQAKDMVGAMADLHGRFPTLFPAKQMAATVAGLAGKNGPELNQLLKQTAAAGQRGTELVNGVLGEHKKYMDAQNQEAQGQFSPVMNTITPTTVRPAPIAPQGAPGAAQPAPPALSGLGTYKTEALKQVAEKYEPELNERVRNSNQLLALMEMGREELKHFKPGGGMTTFAHMAQLADAIPGLPKDIRDAIAGAQKPGELGDVQAAQKYLFGIGSQMATQLLHGSGGRLTQTEWSKTLEEGSPNINMTPKAISSIMSGMRELAHYTKMEQSFLNHMKASPNYDLTRVQNDWSDAYTQLLSRRNPIAPK